MSWIFTHNEDDTVRYSLGKLGQNNLICIGINPSTATPEKLDLTVKRVSTIANLNGYDGWLMLNVYPQRDTYPINIHLKAEANIIQANCEEVKKILVQHEFNSIWAAWGTEIARRPYLYDCLKELHSCFDHNYKWVNYGGLTKKGHPRHPSRMSHSEEFFDFDLTNYLSLVCQ